MFRNPIVINNKIMKALKEILANKEIILKVRDLKFDKEVQVRDEIDELITDLITLRLVLKDTEKNKNHLKLEIKNKLKELEQEKINELKLLEEEIFFMTLRNKHLGRSSHIIKEEEVELREQAKKKINEIEELKEGVEG